MSLHDQLVYAHAAAAVIASIAGIIALLRVKLVGTYAITTFAMTLFVAAAVAVGWGQFPEGAGYAFVGLIGLALYMCWRALCAWQLATVECERRSGAFVDHVGFNLISYFDAFVIVAAINAGWPWWLVAAIAIGAVVVGGAALGRYKRSLGLVQRKEA